MRLTRLKSSHSSADTDDVAEGTDGFGRKRVIESAPGCLVATIGVPIVQSLWAPWQAGLIWAVAYFSTCSAAWLLLLRNDPRVEHGWSTINGALFAWLPISAYLYDPDSRSFWIAAVACMLVIAVETSTLPFAADFEWRTGPFLLTSITTFVAFLEIGPVGLLIAPAALTVLVNGMRLRSTKEWLEFSYLTAESASERAHEMAHNDEMTGLLNRRGLLLEIERLAEQGDFTLVMVDVDRFKAVNDAYGHAAGDDAIRCISNALRERLGKDWKLGRLGGDEFLAVAPLGTALDDEVCAPVDCDVSRYGTESTLSIDLSGGVVLATSETDTDSLLSKVGYAMTDAKRGGGGIARFDEELAVRFDRMLEFSGSDLDPDSFLALFQPIVDGAGSILGCEALCRYEQQDGTILTPDKFLPLLAECGRMDLLNETMLRRGLEFASRFNDVVAPPFVSVNIASTHFSDGQLLPLVPELLAEYDVAPSRLMIEITENDLLDQHTNWHQTALKLLDLGVKLAIDDFGSGYSNIDRLNHLPISDLKFDRSLTTAISGPLGSIARGVVEFAAETGIGIIAEGIETNEELENMQSIGVQLFQGYLFGRPTHPDTLEQDIRSHAATATPTLTPA